MKKIEPTPPVAPEAIISPTTATPSVTRIHTASSPLAEIPTVPVGFVPTPTREYRERRKARRATLGSGEPVRTPIPRAAITGSRVLMWKWDPGEGEIGVRKTFLAGHILAGPRDARIVIEGVPPVIPNLLGDLVATPGTDTFDAIHSFAVVRQTLTMFQRALFPTSVPWQWNSRGNTDPIRVFPRAGETMNAYYSRKEQALKFFHFVPPGATAYLASLPPAYSSLAWGARSLDGLTALEALPVYTCRSQDIVAAETGHAVLDGLKPEWILADKPPQTGALHQSFADLTAIFLMLTQPEQVAALITQTKGNLHNKTFLADLADDTGLALGRPTGLHNVVNELTLNQVGTEVHDLAQVFTGAVYDVLADIVAFELKPNLDPAVVVYTAAEYVCGLLVRAVKAAPDSAATFADVVNQMINVTSLDEKPVQYRNFIRNRFVMREVVGSPTPLTVDFVAGRTLEAKVRDAPDAVQTRYACDGTMQHAQYAGEDTVAPEIEEFVRGLTASSSSAKR